MSAPISVADVDLKIARAEEHLRELDGRVHKWFEAQDINIVQEHDRERGIIEVRLPRIDDPPPEWGPIVGDIGYNLRAALEYIAELLILANGGTPERTNQFPIVAKAEDAHLVATQLRGAHPDAIRAMEEVQPYTRRRGDERYPIEVVASLANVDKHHRLHATAIFTDRVTINWFKIRIPSEVMMNTVMLPSDLSQPISEAYLLGLQFEPPDVEIKVEVDSKFPLPIAIEFRNGMPFPIQILRECIPEVRAVFGRARPFIETPPT